VEHVAPGDLLRTAVGVALGIILALVLLFLIGRLLIS
jgi:hypothetical protein